MKYLLALSLMVLCCMSTNLIGKEPTIDLAEFQKVIRTTEPLTPQQERLQFHLPPGFEIQLVAAEPQIDKPMNMAFDAKGRLWVTTTLEYPLPAKEGTDARDSIKILEDTNGDGRADVVKTFATGLNIPLGIMPYQDGVVCYSIPNIWFLRDTDGDDRADSKEILYGPLGFERDTHGMCNSFTRGYDGWLYATHGFNNHTELSGKDGHTITMKSGNVFRMRWDGSRVEHFSHGLVNPFGMTFDDAGDLFVADCHTKPISLMLREGYYQSFGKPDDGLGYVPDVMEHLHNSTAISGLAINENCGFPEEYHRNTFGGNVMTSRINRDELQQVGSTVRAIEKPDFLIAGDPWFRPVDLKFGPDGALYVADFYNRIIGHYEVSLEHPGRDRHRGRIWRIVYNDPGKKKSLVRSNNFAAMSLKELFLELADSNRVRRMLAADRLVDHFGEQAIAPALSLLRTSAQPTSRIHALWILNRLHKLSFSDLSQATDDSHFEVRLHAYRVLAEYLVGEDAPVAELLNGGMNDEVPSVQRAAVQASAIHRREENIPVLLKLFHSADPQDVHLKHVIKISLRDHFLNLPWYHKTIASISNADIPLVAGISLSLKNEPAGQFIVENLSTLNKHEPKKMSSYITFASQYVSAETVDDLVREIRSRYKQDQEFQRVQMFSVKQGLAKRNQKLPVSLQSWATDLAENLLINADGPQPLGWNYLPGQSAAQPNPWQVTRRRHSKDGRQKTPLFSSLPGGEKATGTYRSERFVLQPEFQFYLCGHDGYPDKPLRNLNFVKLRDANTHEVLKSWQPPRNDVARQFTWQTGDNAGREVVVELVDGNNEAAFAWIAAGRFSEPRLNPSRINRQTQQAIEIIDTFKLHQFQNRLSQLLRSRKMNRHLDSMAALAIVKMQPEARLLALAGALNNSGVETVLRKQIVTAIIQHDPVASKALIIQVMNSASFSEQRALADRLISDSKGLLLLLELLDTGKASARLLTQPELAQKLASLTNEKQKAKLVNIVNSLPKEDERILKLITLRKQSYAISGGDIPAGKVLYEKNCATCHQMAGKGKQVGPNLDGIGNRGLERLCEDILAPNRNVDIAFRSSTILTDEGKVFVGLLKNSEGEQWTLVNNKGELIQIAEKSIDEHKKSLLSPMPANLGEELNDEQFRNLLAYLLSTASSQ